LTLSTLAIRPPRKGGVKAGSILAQTIDFSRGGLG